MKLPSKLWEISASGSIIRTMIFSAGHFLIETSVIHLVTGAHLHLAATASIAGPLVNGLWVWCIDRWWSQRHFAAEHVRPKAPKNRR